MAAGPKKSLALDTNLLLDLAGEKDFALDFKEEFSSRGYSLLVPPTVVTELTFFAFQEHASQHALAVIALERIGIWNCLPFELSATQMVIAHRFAIRLIEASLIPETEQNDGKILAQTALAQIPMLVTSDAHLLNTEAEALLLALNEADLAPVHPVHPKRLLKALR